MMGAHTINKRGMPFMFDLNILDTAEFGESFSQILYAQSCWVIRTFNLYSTLLSLWCSVIPSLF
jgi:hypothetical protein